MCERIELPGGGVAIVCGRNHRRSKPKEKPMSIPDHVNQAPDDYGDLDRWQHGCVPQQAGQLPGVEALADGPLDCEIVEAKLHKTSKTQETIFRLVCRALSGPSTGVVFERPRFFRRQTDLDWLAGELMVLGFPADQWLKSQSFGRSLAAACPSMHGVRFQALKKVEEGDNGEQYPRLYINARLHGTAMPSPAPAAAPAPSYEPPPPVTAGMDLSDVPF